MIAAKEQSADCYAYDLLLQKNDNQGERMLSGTRRMALTRDDVRAALDTACTLSTIACFKYLSIACSIVDCNRIRIILDKCHNLTSERY